MNASSAHTLVVGHLMRTSEHLPLKERAELFAALAELLPGEELQEQARFAAFAFRTAEDAQIKFRDLLAASREAKPAA